MLAELRTLFLILIVAREPRPRRLDGSECLRTIPKGLVAGGPGGKIQKSSIAHDLEGLSGAEPTSIGCVLTYPRR